MGSGLGSDHGCVEALDLGYLEWELSLTHALWIFMGKLCVCLCASLRDHASVHVYIKAYYVCE